MTQHNNSPHYNIGDNNAEASEDTLEAYLFCYEISHTRILIEPGVKMEVLEKTIIYPIPNAPKWYRGVSSLRGDILPVVNMHFLLGVEESAAQKRLLRLEHPNFPALLIAIDKLPYQIKLSTLLTHQGDNSQTIYPNWIKSLASHQHHTVLFADHGTLFQAMQGSVSAPTNVSSAPSQQEDK